MPQRAAKAGAEEDDERAVHSHPAIAAGDRRKGGLPYCG